MSYRSSRAAFAAATLFALSVPAVAATAHNSQAGSYGPTTHVCAPTPYFAAGGCLSETLSNGSTDQIYSRQDSLGGRVPPYRARPPLRGLDE